MKVMANVAVVIDLDIPDDEYNKLTGWMPTATEEEKPHLQALCLDATEEAFSQWLTEHTNGAVRPNEWYVRMVFDEQGFIMADDRAEN